MLEAVGGKLHHLFFALGEHDIVLLAEAPDNSSAVAAAMAALESGSASGTKITALLTMEEAVTAMQKASAAQNAYKPPSA